VSGSANASRLALKAAREAAREAEAMPTAEHILLESDERELPDPNDSRVAHARVHVRSRLRRRALGMEIIDYYYLVIRLYRSGATIAEHLFDLRFVEPSMRLSRHIAWRWMIAAAALVAPAVAAGFLIGASAMPVAWVKVIAGVSGVGIAAAVVGIYRTTETLTLYSAHGQAKLLQFTGGLGVFHACGSFMRKLNAHIKLAHKARRPAKYQHLRDEMREHCRLREAGVLSREEYELSKGRILAEYAPGRARADHAPRLDTRSSARLRDPA
jgi:hypothetical protein